MNTRTPAQRTLLVCWIVCVVAVGWILTLRPAECADPRPDAKDSPDTRGQNASPSTSTRVSIDQGQWHINGNLTYRGAAAEGLLINVRMVNAVFEDANEKTRPKGFHSDANTDQFIRRIPDYVNHGVRAFTLCLQGGHCGYEGAINSAFNPDGSLRESYLKRVQRVIEACDRQGVVVILGCYYQRQDQILKDEAAVRAGVINVTNWIKDRGFTNLVLEIANEFQHGGFDHPILKTADGEAALIALAKQTAPQLLVSTSGLGGGRLPDAVAQASDFLLIHFNSTKVAEVSARIADLKKYGKPIVCNEDDKIGATGAAAAERSVAAGASWGFMHSQLNQYFPRLSFSGAADDRLVYATLKRLATPAGGYVPQAGGPGNGRLRVIVETDAGGDPDDEQSLVRFLLYANEWDVEGIIANRALARDGENRNRERTGLTIVQRLVKTYGECHANLARHDARYPTAEELLGRTVSGYEDSDAGVKLILAAVDSDDPRPIWFMNWGTDHGAASSSLTRALDRVLKERGPAGYAKFKNRLRLSSDDQFGGHTNKIEPPFALWVDTFRPEMNRKRWYHRFSALTATAGGFDLQRDVMAGHGPLGALYPTNTTHTQKEGDTMTFLYLAPTGMNDPRQPAWGSWAGRYGRRDEYPDKPHFWANQADTWQGTTHRENTLKRWAVHLQNDFKARMDWCVTDFDGANHPPFPRINDPLHRTVISGDKVAMDASGSTDPDQQKLQFEWIFYPEAGTYQGEIPDLHGATAAQASFIAPQVQSAETLHVVLVVTDGGSPPLTRYQRAIITVEPKLTAGSRNP